MKNRFLLIILSFTFLLACEPYIEDDIKLPQAPNPPEFSVDFLTDNPNKAVVTDLSQGNFSRVWDFGKNAEGKSPTPATSTLQSDTVTFYNKGDYTITLHVSASNGGGTAAASTDVSVADDLAGECDDLTSTLTGECGTEGKCWTFTHEARAVVVGPTPGSDEWFTSGEDGLVPEQYDDSFCFYFDDRAFQYFNNGQTIDPWNGYVAVDYDPPTDHVWQLIPDGGANGEPRVILTEGSFLGVWDSGPVYDIIEMTETKLVVRSQIIGNSGWFDLTFVAL